MTHHINEIALFRLSVLGPLVSRNRLERGELKVITEHLAKQTYQIPNSHRVHVSAKTIERWYHLWRKEGIDGLIPHTRCDKGHCSLSADLQQSIIHLKMDNPARSINTIIKLLEMDGLARKGQLSRSTVHRLLQTNHLSKRKLDKGSEMIERRAFEAKLVGDIWYGDVMHGPRIVTKSGMRKTYLATVMDDKSRLICHSAFCLDESALSIEYVLKQALLKRGLPKCLVVDNGPAYRAASLQGICARLKIRLVYCRPYEPEGKGKLERWHRTVRAQFLTEIDVDSIHGLEAINARLWAWIETVYHSNPHSGLADKMTPLQYWQKHLTHVQPLGNIAAQLDHYFLHRIKRLVRKDGTVSWSGKTYEVDYTLSDRYIYLVIDPHEISAKWAESLEYERLSAVHLLDKQANNHKKRARPKLLTSDTDNKPKRHLVESVYQYTEHQFNLCKPQHNTEEK